MDNIVFSGHLIDIDMADDMQLKSLDRSVIVTEEVCNALYETCGLFVR